MELGELMFDSKHYKLVDFIYVDAFDYVYAAYVAACLRCAQARWDKVYFHANKQRADALINDAIRARHAAWRAVCDQSLRNRVTYPKLH